MSDPRHTPAFAVLRQADALLAWVLLGWLGQRLGWSFASGVLPVVVWWAVRCGGNALDALGSAPRAWVPTCAAGALGLLASLAMLPAGPMALAALLLGSALWGAWSAALAAGDRTLSGQAMGLMMGSLWLGSQWCLGPGWTDGQAVALHLVLMTGLPLLVAVARRHAPARWRVSPRLLAAMLAAGALLMASAGGTEGRLAGMVLLVMAWSLGAGTPNPARSPLPAALAPVLLLAVGLTSPTHGPLSLQWAYCTLGVLALWTALVPRLADDGRASSRLIWKDAS